MKVTIWVDDAYDGMGDIRVEQEALQLPLGRTRQQEMAQLHDLLMVAMRQVHDAYRLSGSP